MFGRTFFYCCALASHSRRLPTPAFALGRIISVVAVLLLPIGLRAANSGSQEQGGINVGERAPGFTLKDQNGQDVSLDGLLKKGPVALVFFRSSDWCLACKTQLIKLQRHTKEFEVAGGQLVGISYDSAKSLKCFADKRSILFPVLSDTGSKVIDAYGVRDPVEDLGPKGVARHIAIVVDQKGIVRGKRYGVIYDERPGVDDLVQMFKEAQNPVGGTTQ